MARVRTRTGAHVAFASSSRLPLGAADDRPAMDALARHGVSTTEVRWDDPHASWAEFELVVLRSTWDYHEHLEEFLAWVERVSRETVLRNTAEIVRGNARKRYLLELARRGHAVVPTELVPRGSRVGLVDVMAARGWAEVVVKPEVGANSEGLFRVGRTDAEAAGPRWHDALAKKDMLVQPFLSATHTEGERSLVFFRGEFSHAVSYRSVLDVPARTVIARRASDPEIEAGRKILADLPTRPVYARLDYLAEGNDRWLLGELELIEPELFLRSDDAAGERFAQAILAELYEE